MLGVSHLIVSSVRQAETVRALEKDGYHADLVVPGLPNPPEKAAFLNEFNALHNIAICSTKGAVALEVVEQGANLSNAPSPYAPIFGLDDEPLEALVESYLAKVETIDMYCHSLGQRVWRHGSGSSHRVRLLRVGVKNIEASEKFWSGGMGFQVVKRGESEPGNWVLLSMSAPLPQWSLSVLLVEDPHRRELPMLDSPGISCVALLTRDLAGESERLVSAGASARSEEFHLDVGAKRFHIGFFRGPNEELVEILHVVKAA